MDQFVALQTSNALQSILQKKDGSAREKAFAFVAVLCADSIKKLADSLTTAIFSEQGGVLFLLSRYVKDILKHLYNAVWRVVKTRLSMMTRSVSRSSLQTDRLDVSTVSSSDDIREKEDDITKRFVDDTTNSACSMFKPNYDTWKTLLALPRLDQEREPSDETPPLQISFTYDNEGFHMSQINAVEYKVFEVLKNFRLWRTDTNSPFCVEFDSDIETCFVYRKKKQPVSSSMKGRKSSGDVVSGEMNEGGGKGEEEENDEVVSSALYDKVLIHVNRYVDNHAFANTRQGDPQHVTINDISDIVPFPKFCEQLRAKVIESMNMCGLKSNSTNVSIHKISSIIYTVEDRGWYTHLVALLHANGIYFCANNFGVILHELYWLLCVCNETPGFLGHALFGIVIPNVIATSFSTPQRDVHKCINEMLSGCTDYDAVLQWFRNQLSGSMIMTDVVREVQMRKSGGGVETNENGVSHVLPCGKDPRLTYVRKMVSSFKSTGRCMILNSESFWVTVRLLNADHRIPASKLITRFHGSLELCREAHEKKETVMSFSGVGRPSDIYTLSVIEKYESGSGNTASDTSDSHPSSRDRNNGSDDDDEDGGKKTKTKKKTASGFLASRSGLVKNLVVETNLVNTTTRSMSTVYLRKEDERTLYRAMDNFKFRSDVLRAMGIPNKLGIMLYGIPGTGKSSVIQAVSTYLEKDMYYLRLNSLRTNSALKKAFDHVVKGCSQKGGIVILEDVDAMTDVVKKRVPTSGNNSVPETTYHRGSVHAKQARHPRRYNQSQLPYFGATAADEEDYFTPNYGAQGSGLDDEKDDLTLEYLLNVLQGSLTLDGTVFIATTNHLECLDEAFYRRGRFDVCIEMRPCDRYQLSRMFEKFFKRPLREETLEAFVEDAFPAVQIVSRMVEYMFEEGVDETLVLAPFLSRGPEGDGAYIPPKNVKSQTNTKMETQSETPFFSPGTPPPSGDRDHRSVPSPVQSRSLTDRDELD